MSIKTAHLKIKNSILGDGFKYIHPKERAEMDIDPDKFARSFKNYGFTLRVNGQEFAARESATHLRLNFIVEFILDGAHDQYLEKIDDAVASIWALRGVVSQTVTNTKQEQLSWAAFNMEWRNDYVILVFPNINITIKSI